MLYRLKFHVNACRTGGTYVGHMWTITVVGNAEITAYMRAGGVAIRGQDMVSDADG
jgi:hypothetical protein